MKLIGELITSLWEKISLDSLLETLIAMYSIVSNTGKFLKSSIRLLCNQKGLLVLDYVPFDHGNCQGQISRISWIFLVVKFLFSKFVYGQ